MSQSGAERIAAYRQRRKANGIEDASRRYAKFHKRESRSTAKQERPFVGCDGEGCGTDDSGRQLYRLFRMGNRELYTGQPLRTEELLDFICDEPTGSILVGFAFGYDVTMILRDLPPAQVKRLFQPKRLGQGFSPYVWFKNFNIDYLPRQYFKVCRVRVERDTNGRERRKVIKGSTRTIYETFGFFQKSFLKVVQEFGIGSEAERNIVKENKSRRAEFSTIGDEERRYCGLEVNMLAELMEKLRDYCTAAGIVPRTWNGAGKLAGALHALHETPTAQTVASLVPNGVGEFANLAYYGGRFEISRLGNINQEVYEYDIRSAYPDVMRRLPCLLHGTWQKVDAKTLEDHGRRNDRLYIAAGSFKARRDRDGSVPCFGGLPIRSKEGHLYWPAQGAGVYWSPEIESAKRLGFAFKATGGWLYTKQCSCTPFDWIEPLYEYRRSIGSGGPGYPIKLGINSLYGLTAQRKGNGKYTNMIWAGLITAMTRAKLNDAIAANPKSVVMVATDAVYSVDPIVGLDCDVRLGCWEENRLEGIFIVQPGLYWCPAKRKKKSRGLSGKFFEDLLIDGVPATEKFEAAWERWRQEQNSKLDTPFPEVSVPVPSFIGLKLAMARNDPAKAGCWVQDHRVISFDYRNKRSAHDWLGEGIITKPKLGFRGLVSLPHREFLAKGGAEPWENARAMLEEQPDFVDLSAPYME